MATILQGRGSPLELKPTDPVRVIGERINPSGKARLRQALLDRDWEYLAGEARLQVEAGADVIDVNVGGQGLDEAALLPEAVRVVSEAVSVPLSIDTRLPAALEAALQVCPGRPLVNSIGGERKILAENLPLVVRYGVPVIVLCMGQEGIPNDVDGRLRAAGQVLEAAVRLGVREEDIVFDPLVMTVGADDQAGRMALACIQRLRVEFPHSSITGGASNVSYGMPDRAGLNASFLTAACVMGMNIPITDPTHAQLAAALRSADVFNGRDRRLRRYMQSFRQKAPGGGG